MRCALLFLAPVAGWAAQLEILTLSNWHRLPVGDRAMVEGGAIVARVNGPASAFNNPAGLAHLDRPSISGSLSGIEYTRVGSRSTGGTAEANQASLKPNLVGFASAIDENDAGSGGWGFVLATPVTWESAMEVRSSSSSGTRRDDGRSSFEMLVPGLAWGAPFNEQLSVGISLETWLIEYRLDSGTSATDGTTLLSATYTENGRAVALRIAGGAQWNAGAWRFGAMVRSPGLVVADQGTISASTTSGDNVSTTHTDVRDDQAGFVYPLPLTATVGVAWRPESLPAYEIELDVSVTAGHTPVSVFGPATGTTTTLSGGSSTTDAYTLPARRLDQRVVTNPRLGMSYRLEEPILGRIVRLHVGAYLDRSPVSSSDVFSRLDLLAGTGGISAEKGPMQLTIGGAYVTSSTLSDALGYVTSPDSGLQPSLENPDATFAVRSFVLSIGSSYRF